MADKLDTIRSTPIWKETYHIVELMYGAIDKLIADYPHEEWATASKLRNSANDTLFYMAQSVGGDAAEKNIYDWNNARKNIFALQSMYIFATKQNMLELEPEIIVKIDRIIKDIDVEIKNSRDQIKKKTKEEMEPWLERYRLWQAMQDK